MQRRVSTATGMWLPCLPPLAPPPDRSSARRAAGLLSLTDELLQQVLLAAGAPAVARAATLNRRLRASQEQLAALPEPMHAVHATDKGRCGYKAVIGIFFLFIVFTPLISRTATATAGADGTRARLKWSKWCRSAKTCCPQVRGSGAAAFASAAIRLVAKAGVLGRCK